MSKHGKGRGSTPIKKFLPKFLLNPLITLHDFFSAHVCLGGGGHPLNHTGESKKYCDFFLNYIFPINF